MHMSPKQAVEFFNQLEERKPAVGRLVTVNQGVRKHAGKVGHVVWHGVNQYAKMIARDAIFVRGGPADVSRGTFGYRVKVKPVDGSPPFFVDAEKVSIAIRCD